MINLFLQRRPRYDDVESSKKQKLPDFFLFKLFKKHNVKICLRIQTLMHIIISLTNLHSSSISFLSIQLGKFKRLKLFHIKYAVLKVP